MRKWSLIAGALALLAVWLTGSPARAQPAGPTLPSALMQFPGVTFSVTITETKAGSAPEQALTLSGRFNQSGEFEAQLSVPSENESISLVFVGERFYVQINNEGWQYVDSNDLLGAASGLGAGTAAPSPMDASDPCDAIADTLPQTFFSQLGNLQNFGTVQPPVRTTVNGVAVMEYRGTLNLVAIFKFVGTLLASDPECAASIGEFGSILDDLQTEDSSVPPIAFVLDLGVQDQFPYHVELTISDDEETVTFAANLTPSSAPFTIQAPANATPFNPSAGSIPSGLLGPGPVLPPRQP